MEGTLLLTRGVAFLRLNRRARFHPPLFSSFVLRDSYKEICCGVEVEFQVKLGAR